jgi:hypothetical protein
MHDAAKGLAVTDAYNALARLCLLVATLIWCWRTSERIGRLEEELEDWTHGADD